MGEGPDGRFEPRRLPGSERVIPADLVLLALGFVGPEKAHAEGLGVKLDDRNNVWTDDARMTSVPGVFAAGDMSRGQSLVVWAIREGREAAQAVDRYLSYGRPCFLRSSRRRPTVTGCLVAHNGSRRSDIPVVLRGPRRGKGAALGASARRQGAAGRATRYLH